MLVKILLLNALTRLVTSSPVAQASNTAVPQKPIRVEQPKNFYIEPDLDTKRPYTSDAKFSVVRYGPWEVPAMSMIDNKKIFNQAKPCDECYITAMQADLQYPNGTVANIDTGGWLHHIVIYTGLGWTPGSKQDLVCSYTLLSAFMGWPHRIFASGNERTPVRLNHRYKFGMSIEKDEVIHILLDLVNVAPYTQSFNVVITYEWVPKNTPGYRPARLIWTDVTGCGTSEAPAQEGVYELKSPGWISTIGGVMLATLGHVHDGGVYTSLYINKKVVCQSDQFYGTKPEFFEGRGMTNLNVDEKGGMNHGHAPMQGGNMPSQPQQPHQSMQPMPSMPSQPQQGMQPGMPKMPAAPQPMPNMPSQPQQGMQPGMPKMPAAPQPMPNMPSQPQQGMQPGMPKMPAAPQAMQPDYSPNYNPAGGNSRQQPGGINPNSGFASANQNGQIGWQQPNNNQWPPNGGPQIGNAFQPGLPNQYQGNPQSQGNNNGFAQNSPAGNNGQFSWRTIPIDYRDEVSKVQRNAPRPPLETSGMTHVSESSSCINFGILHIGDNVELGATYNSTAHFQNRNHMHESSGFLSWFGLGTEPKYAPVMGINPFYIGEGQMTLD